MTDYITPFFSSEGPLIKHIKGYQPRQVQIDMAKAVSDVIAFGGQLVVEAGTGTGKTYAYLVPAMLSGKKTIVSTGTKYLQDQLFVEDLPKLRPLIGARPLTVALLKGRANYLCWYRIKTLRHRGQFDSKAQVEQFYAIEKYASVTTVGDIGQCESVPENSPIFAQVTSTTENCLGVECPDYDSCFVVKARKAALDADIIVINHHLFCADLALKQEGFGELLPAAEVIIIDEAHQLAEVAGQFFSQQIGTRQLVELVRDLDIFFRIEMKEETSSLLLMSALEEACLNLQQCFNSGQKLSMSDAMKLPLVPEKLQGILEALNALGERLQMIAEQNLVLVKLWQRVKELLQLWQQLVSHDSTLAEAIIWVEVHKHHISLHATPVNIAEPFQKHSRGLKASWVFTSATLAVGSSFEYFCRPLGITPETTLQLQSPFDYPRRALFFHPLGLPDPMSSHYSDKMLTAILPILQASKGRAFILFTSYQALTEAAAFLSKNITYPLFIQGNMPKLRLLDAFRQSGNGILLGTNSFWEGVDVKGEALTCVIIAKLPFAAHTDPVEQARIELLKQQGKNSFMEYQVPRAVIALKQGIGRLIRGVEDYGVLVIADPRLLSKNYGKFFLDSLPPMTRTHQVARVENFFAYMVNINES